MGSIAVPAVRVLFSHRRDADAPPNDTSTRLCLPESNYSSTVQPALQRKNSRDINSGGHSLAL